MLPAPCSFWRLLVYLGFIALYLCFIPISSPRCMASPLVRTLVVGSGAHPDRPGGSLHLKILHVFISPKIISPNMVTFTGSGNWDPDISFWIPFLGLLKYLLCECEQHRTLPPFMLPSDLRLQQSCFALQCLNFPYRRIKCSFSFLLITPTSLRLRHGPWTNWWAGFH